MFDSKQQQQHETGILNLALSSVHISVLETYTN